MKPFLYALCFLVVGASILLGQEARPRSEATARSEASTPEPRIVFAVWNDEELTYPASARYLPDEHTTVLPAPRAVAYLERPGLSGPHNFFVAMSNAVGGTTYDGSFSLQSSDFRNLEFAPGFGNADHGKAIFWAPHPGSGNCGYKTVTHFDEQYAAPGSVLQDPTQPPGNLIMIYEAEIHCPVSPQGMGAGWVSIGVARSPDGGKTWPPPVARPNMENDWLEYGDGRYAGITIPGTPPKMAFASFYGDVLPSAFIDDMDPSGEYHIYVPYQFTGDLTHKADARIHIARAKIGDRAGHRDEGQLHFYKWYQGGWKGEGRGGEEDAVMPACGASIGEGGGQIEYNDALRRYMMTFVCSTYYCPPTGSCYPTQLSLFYSTATSLTAEDWTEPRLIQNSTYTDEPAPNNSQIIDGGYPSFVSPGCEPGHIGLSGTVFLLKGNPLGNRQFVAREFSIRSLTPIAKEPGQLENGCRPHNGPTPEPPQPVRH